MMVKEKLLIIKTCIYMMVKVKGKVFYGQEPPSGESTKTESGVNYQLLSVMTEAAHWGTPSCSQPQPAENATS